MLFMQIARSHSQDVIVFIISTSETINDFMFIESDLYFSSPLVFVVN